jgi:hypothetical protein
MKARLLVPALVSTASFAVAGCGSSSDDTKTLTVSSTSAAQASTATASRATTPTVDKEADQQIAAAALLKLSDFPPGWTASPREDDEDDDSLLNCGGLRDQWEKRSGRAQTPDFAHGNEAEASNSVLIFPDDAPARAYIDAMTQQEVLDCITKGLQDSIEDTSSEDLEIGDVKTSQLRVPDRGDDSVGVRIEIPITAQSIDLTASADITLVRVGRALTAVVVYGIFSPVSDTERDRLGSVATDRLTSALAR